MGKFEQIQPNNIEGLEPQIFDYWERQEMLKAIDNFINQFEKLNYDMLIFLDESGRLWSHLFMARFKRLYPDKKLPEIKYLKTGKEFVITTDKGSKMYPGAGKESMQPVISEIRKAFHAPSGCSYFDDNRVLVVDSFVWSGGALKLAADLLKESFPRARTFDKAAILSEGTKKSNEIDKGFIDRELVLTPTYTGTDIEKTVAKAPATGEHKGAFIRPLQKNIDELIDSERNIWQRIKKVFGDETEPALPPDKARAVEDLREMKDSMAKRYGKAIKEIEEFAAQGVKQTPRRTSNDGQSRQA